MEYNVPVPDSLKAKGPKLGRPRNAQDERVAEKIEAKVVLDTKRRRVRLRGSNYPLPCTTACEGREYSITLQPNRWTDVPEPIYQMLRHKFGQTQEREVPDWTGGENPQRVPRMESPNAPIIEGL